MGFRRFDVWLPPVVGYWVAVIVEKKYAVCPPLVSQFQTLIFSFRYTDGLFKIKMVDVTAQKFGVFRAVVHHKNLCARR